MLTLDTSMQGDQDAQAEATHAQSDLTTDALKVITLVEKAGKAFIREKIKMMTV